ncbi:CinA family protein [Nocardioides bigeumensis]|uniref:CinA family protein n=1 Tax=Nocardioides bigeumensis TaxID=433657 RepID=UPI0031CDD260
MSRAADPAYESAARLLRTAEGAGATLAVAESLTGGRLAAALTAVPGASAVVLGGVVAYSPEMKRDLLGVPATLIETHGVVSAECARAMATGVRAVTGATYGVSTTGVAGPEPSEGHPVGTVFVGVDGPGGTTALALELTGDRATIQARTVAEALGALADRLAEG